MVEAAGTSRRGRLARRLLVMGATLGATLLAVELAARARFGVPLAERLPIVRIQADPKTGWRMVPGEAHYTYEHRVTVNALGLRGPEVAPKRAGERRVLALGDSLIYGQGVADAETVPAQLEAALRARGGEWTVVNGGHRAFDTNQELALLEDLGPAIDADVVVLFWFWNDIRERDVAGTHERLASSGPVAFDTGAAMEGWTLWRWRCLQLARKSALAMTAHDLWQARRGNPPAGEEVDAALARLEGYLERLRALAAREGYELVFAAVPDANMLLDSEEAPHFTAAITARATELARGRGIKTCELEDGLVAATRALGALPVLPYDGHYTGAANRVIAEAVALCIVTR